MQYSTVKLVQWTQVAVTGSTSDYKTAKENAHNE